MSGIAQNIVPIISYVIGTGMMFGAGVYSLKNYRITRHISHYWALYGIAMFNGSLQALIYIYQFAYGVDPILDSLRKGLAAILAIMLALVAVEMVTTDIGEVLE